MILKNDDFQESDLEGIRGASFQVASLTLGPEDYAGDLVRAFVMHDVDPLISEYEVRLRDGSIIQAKRMDIAKGGLAIEEVSGPIISIDPGEIAQVRAGSRRVQNLIGLSWKCRSAQLSSDPQSPYRRDTTAEFQRRRNAFRRHPYVGFAGSSIIACRNLGESRSTGDYSCCTREYSGFHAFRKISCVIDADRSLAGFSCEGPSCFAHSRRRHRNWKCCERQGRAGPAGFADTHSESQDVDFRGDVRIAGGKTASNRPGGDSQILNRGRRTTRMPTSPESANPATSDQYAAISPLKQETQSRLRWTSLLAEALRATLHC